MSDGTDAFALTMDADGIRPAVFSHAHLEPGTLVDGRYRVEEKVGQGGTGAVYRATQTTMSRSVALKCLSPQLAADEQSVARFRREAMAITQLGHPNVVTVYDLGSLPDKGLYLALEFLDGPTLRAKLLEKGRLSPARAVHIAGQICDALEAAHSREIVHRDLKPENVLLTHHAGNVDFVKVVDWGLARLAGSGITSTGEVFGTPAYMAPEQIKGVPSDGRTDIYALGCMLYEMLSGAPPFTAGTPMALLMRASTERPKPLSQVASDAGISQDLEDLVLAALEKDPGNRPQSAAELRDALRASLGGHDEDPTVADPNFHFDDRSATRPMGGQDPGMVFGAGDQGSTSAQAAAPMLPTDLEATSEGPALYSLSAEGDTVPSPVVKVRPAPPTNIVEVTPSPAESSPGRGMPLWPLALIAFAVAAVAGFLLFR